MTPTQRPNEFSEPYSAERDADVHWVGCQNCGTGVNIRLAVFRELAYVLNDVHVALDHNEPKKVQDAIGMLLGMCQGEIDSVRHRDIRFSELIELHDAPPSLAAPRGKRRRPKEK